MNMKLRIHTISQYITEIHFCGYKYYTHEYKELNSYSASDALLMN